MKAKHDLKVLLVFSLAVFFVLGPRPHTSVSFSSHEASRKKPMSGFDPERVLPYIGMCGLEGYGFSAVLVINRASILAIIFTSVLVINRVSISAL